MIDRALLADSDRFFRIPLGGRPMAVRSLQDDRHEVVANGTVATVVITKAGPTP